jgi:hypothetical protein
MQRNTNLIWKGEPGLYLVWVEQDEFGCIDHEEMVLNEFKYSVGVHSKQGEETPTTLELIPEEKFSHDVVLKRLLSMCLKSSTFGE